jgi:DNA-binding NarL/FixJ family response regulator
VDSVIRVLLADDHPLFRKGLRAVLDDAPGISVVAEAADGDAALARITAGGIDVAVLDLDMPHQDGIQVARAARGLNLPVRMILLTAHKSDALANEALDAGVLGYILKDGAVTDILDCVRRVHAGQHYVSPQLSNALLTRRARAEGLATARPGLATLTATERRVLALVADGRTSREIAEGMFISVRTVEHHRASIGQKLNLHGATALLRFAVAHRSELPDAQNR